MARRVYILLVFLPIFIILFPIQGQFSNLIHEQLRFNYLTIDDGLQNNRVRGLTQDNYGFIWIGTRKGIVRFDGYSIKQYNTFSSDTSDNHDITSTNAMFCDSRDRLWATGEYGICYFDWEEDKFKRFEHKDLDVDITACDGIDEDKDTSIWFATGQGLLKFNQRTDELLLYLQEADNPKAPPLGYIFKVAVSLNNHIWYGLAQVGVGYLDPETGIFTHFQSGSDSTSLAEDKLEQLYVDKKGNVWVGHNNNGVSKFSYETGKFRRYYPEPGRKEAGRVSGICEDSKGNFWFGTQGGLYLFNPENEKFTRYAYAEHPISTLSHSSIKSMIIDNQEGLWLGTFAGGVSYTNLNSSGIVKYEYSKIPSEYYLNDKNVYSLAFDNEGNIWAGTENGGLNFLDIETGKFTFFTKDQENKNTPRSNNIKDIYVDANGLVWFGTYKGGISIYNPANKRFKHYMRSPEFPAGIDDEVIYIVYPDVMDQNILWIGSINRLYMFNKEEEVFTHINQETPGFTNTPAFNRVFSVCHTKDNKMVFGGDKIMILDRSTNTFTTYEDINGNNIGQADFVLLDKYGYIWADLNGSNCIARLNLETGEFEVFGESRGMPLVNYLQATDDDEGNLWLSTDQGIWKLRNIINTPDTFSVTQYDNSDNVQSLEFLYNSKAVGPSGEILFGGINGFNSFKPKNIRPNPYVPNVIVTKLVIAGEEVKVGQKIEGRVLLDKPIMEIKNLHFHHKIKIFTFHFTAFHFVAPENNQFKFMLENYDKDWNYTDANIRTATYSNIPRGTYVFKVDATNNNGKWSNNLFTITIKITPPFWKTIWFYTIVVVFIAFLVFLFIKWREQQLLRDKQILEDKLRKGQEEITKSKEEIKKQQQALEEKERQERVQKWHNVGLAKFADIFREYKDDLQVLAHNFNLHCMKYLEAELGGVFLAKENENETILELAAHYAFSTEMLEKRIIYPGEGLVGECYKSKKLIQIDDLPDKFVKLTSGLGESKLSCIMLLPIMHDENIVGVLELISKGRIEDYKIEFLRKISESMVSVVTSAQSSNMIQEMLSKSQLQAEQLQAQEEEMRQNLEEMQATQEDAQRREKQLEKKLEDTQRQLSNFLKGKK